MAEQYTMDQATKAFLFNYFVFHFPLIIFGSAMLWIGVANIPKSDSETNGCPSAEGLPYLLLAGGILLIVGVNIRHGLSKMCIKEFRVGGKFGGVVLYDTVLVMLSVAWCIAGCVYAAGNMNQEVFVCTTTVYNMTIVSLAAGILVTALASVFLVFGRLCCKIVCCKPCRVDEDEVITPVP